MDQRLERLKQIQKEMQDQLQIRMQEQLAKIQQDMRDQMLESQRSMMSQLTQLLTEGLEKGKSLMVNPWDDNEDPAYPPGFTPINTQAQPNAYVQRVFINVRPQYQTGTSAPTSFPTGLGSNPGGKPANPVALKQLEDRCRWLEEKFKAMENADYHCKIDVKNLSLVSDLVLHLKFKNSEFEKYNGTSCPEAHITILIGSTAKWYNKLSRAKINSWKDLVQAFMKQYSHVTDMTPDRITLQNMEKK
ncbi:putative DNA double-strand break repair Rad50 ATPase [Gossypium australe]|uniref:Putative DNA double-strand break repair Rad50 ATPase n=1 Tax=Gossypium australe TaxID=47621 RepID=A0A5B6X642_9ROSI|nr:putative DNA double-strand break repair Rad50 ATPase [Gossypium australe]